MSAQNTHSYILVDQTCENIQADSYKYSQSRRLLDFDAENVKAYKIFSVQAKESKNLKGKYDENNAKFACVLSHFLCQMVTCPRSAAPPKYDGAYEKILQIKYHTTQTSFQVVWELNELAKQCRERVHEIVGCQLSERLPEIHAPLSSHSLTQQKRRKPRMLRTLTMSS